MFELVWITEGKMYYILVCLNRFPLSVAEFVVSKRTHPTKIEGFFEIDAFQRRKCRSKILFHVSDSKWGFRFTSSVDNFQICFTTTIKLNRLKGYLFLKINRKILRGDFVPVISHLGYLGIKETSPLVCLI